VTVATQELNSYVASFQEFEKVAVGRSLPWLQKLRRDAFARFREAGFPTTHHEDWRFTNVSAIAQTPFQLIRQATPPSAAELQAWRIEAVACRLVFVNGRFAPSLSRLDGLSAGVQVTSLAAQIANHPDTIEPFLGRDLDIQRDSFSALNTAFVEDGAYVRIRRGTVLEAPIHLLFVSVADAQPVMNHPRNLIVAEEGSQAAIIEDYASLEGVVFSNTATELIVEDNAVVNHYLLERESSEAFNVSTLRIQQSRGASVTSHSVLLGGRMVRNNVHPVLAGEGGECLINGLYIGNERQHLDNYMLVEHASPHCSSHQFYNGVLDGHAHGVFHGRIIVHKHAQKTDAKQTNRNLLLSDDAQIDSKPQLEIYADDVKCTHGATIGQIEEDALFYLRSRGLDETSARNLLLLAFASESLDRMKEGAVRSYVEKLVNRSLFGAARQPKARAAAGRDGAGKELE
jgi:Fe-S cluster assembly protein SufD